MEGKWEEEERERERERSQSVIYCFQSKEQEAAPFLCVFISLGLNSEPLGAASEVFLFFLLLLLLSDLGSH